jgi:hypothetical protein
MPMQLPSLHKTFADPIHCPTLPSSASCHEQTSLTAIKNRKVKSFIAVCFLFGCPGFQPQGSRATERFRGSYHKRHRFSNRQTHPYPKKTKAFIATADMIIKRKETSALNSSPLLFIEKGGQIGRLFFYYDNYRSRKLSCRVGGSRHMGLHRRVSPFHK